MKKDFSKKSEGKQGEKPQNRMQILEQKFELHTIGRNPKQIFLKIDPNESQGPVSRQNVRMLLKDYFNGKKNFTTLPIFGEDVESTTGLGVCIGGICSLAKVKEVERVFPGVPNFHVSNKTGIMEKMTFLSKNSDVLFIPYLATDKEIAELLAHVYHKDFISAFPQSIFTIEDSRLIPLGLASPEMVV